MFGTELHVGLVLARAADVDLALGCVGIDEVFLTRALHRPDLARRKSPDPILLDLRRRAEHLEAALQQLVFVDWGWRRTRAGKRRHQNASEREDTRSSPAVEKGGHEIGLDRGVPLHSITCGPASRGSMRAGACRVIAARIPARSARGGGGQ